VLVDPVEVPMSVLFPIATRRDWAYAVSAGTYTMGSLHGDDVIPCSTAAQHATVANARFASRTELVLLLMDTDKLASEVRFEYGDGGGQAVPHVRGPLPLDAVFEATPYQPGVDGRFRPHEEASGHAADQGMPRRIHRTDQAELSCVGDGPGAVGRLRLAGYDQHASTTNCSLDTRRLVATADRTHAAANQGRYP
jgi:uncharacterized protein (DUF952 family)